MPTNRNIALCIIFSLLTGGIYTIYWFVKLTDELNTVSPSTKTAGGGTAFVYSLLSFGIYTLYWMYKQGQKVDEAKGAPGGNTGVLYLVLTIFGLGIVSYCLMQDEVNRFAAPRY